MIRLVTLFREIRERRIFRYFISYLATGWIALEVVDQFVGRDVLPAIAYPITLLWYIGGIPACLIIGWFHGEKGDQKAPRSEVFILSVIGVVCVALTSTAVSGYRSTRLAIAAAENGLDQRRVAVLYFDDITRGGELQYLADGLTEDLIRELERVRTLDVVTRNGSAQFRDTDLSTDSIAQALQAGTIVDGTVERVGDRVRVNVRLLDASGAEFKRAGFERPVSDVFAIRDELAQEASRFLREWLGEEIRLRELKRETGSPVSWALYQRAERARKDAEELSRHDDHAGANRAFRQADSLLAQAELVDGGWAEPTILRGYIAYRQARLVHDPHASVGWIQTGLGHSERALAKERDDPAALELRGMLRYWHWLLDVVADPEEQQKLLLAAREDLERAVEADPTLANAHNFLSHMNFRAGDVATGLLEARRAYEEDAYLDVANEVLARLSTGYYDLQEFSQAKRWCDEGLRRFPQDHRFTHCQLLLMTSRAVPPDVAAAWKLRDQLTALTPPELRPGMDARSEMYVSGVIARAGLQDSARAVLDRAYARVTPEIDPKHDLLRLRAYLMTLSGNVGGAIDVLKQYAAMVPNSSFDHYWWWQEVRAHPRFRELPRGHHADH